MSLIMASEVLWPTGMGPWSEVYPHLFVPFLLMPPAVRAALWASFGLVAIFAALTRNDRHIMIASVALVVMPAERASSFMVAAIDAATRGDRIWFDVARTSVMWGGVAVLVMILAGWRDRGRWVPPWREDGES